MKLPRLMLLAICLIVSLSDCLIVSAPAADRSANVTTAQVTLSTTASVVSAASTVRQSVVVRNTDAAISIYVGVAGVTSSTGFLLKAGESLTIHTRAAVYAVAASGTPVVSVLTEND